MRNLFLTALSLAMLSLASIALATDFTDSPKFTVPRSQGGTATGVCDIKWLQTRTSPDFWVGQSKSASLPNVPLFVSSCCFQLSKSNVPTMTISVGYIGDGAYSATYESTALTGAAYTFVKGDAGVTWPATITPR